MKKLLSLLFSIFLIQGIAAAQIITANIVITNLPAYPNSITVNSLTRTWTNNVTTAYNQIQITNSIGWAATNLFLSYVITPSSYLNLARYSSNGITLQSYVGRPLVVTLSSGWGTVSLQTNYITNNTVFEGTPNTVNNYDRTNIANGIFQFLTNSALTNAFPTNAPLLSNYLTIGSVIGEYNLLSNLSLNIGTNATNYTLTASNNLWASIVAATNGIGSAAYQSVNAFQHGSVNLSNWSALSTNVLTGNSYLVGNNIVLQNPTHPYTRLEADEGGGFVLNYEDGVNFLAQDNSHDVLITDHSTVVRFIANDASQDNGSTVLQSKNNFASVHIGGLHDTVETYAPVVGNIHFWPITYMGGVTNFYGLAQNSGTGSTSVDAYNIPANTITNQGDSIIRTIGIQYTGTSATKDVQVSLAGSGIFDSGAIANAGSGGCSIYCEITVLDASTLSSATLAVNIRAVASGSANTPFAKVSTISGVDLTSTIDFHIVLQVGIDGSTGDIVVVTDNSKLALSPHYAALH